ncbi:uncharacterized protein LOC143450304 isoform X1 [Clavelina lepadiformis]|uniref:uncharacterized protein LOC143450304 isoform X1 n=1 Tax=Clavelina lepadiformis TaxID=159417 RepID=UPI00404169E6
MSSKHVSVKSRSKATVAQYRRQWLKSQLDAVKERCKETLVDFKKKVDSVSDKPINAAEQLLFEKDDDQFLSDVFEMGQALQKCTDDLFEIHFSCCFSDNDISEDGTESPTMEKLDKVALKFENLPSKSVNDLNHPKELFTRSGSTTLMQPSEPKLEVFEPLSLDTSAILSNFMTPSKVESMSVHSTRSSEEATSKVTNINKSVTKKEFPVVLESSTPSREIYDSEILFSSDDDDSYPEVTNKDIVNKTGEGRNYESKEANHSHKSKLQRGLKFQDLGLVLLHNISYEEQVSVVVSDVTSPSMFSVQIKKGSRQLISIQQQINNFYSQTWTKRLQYEEPPKVGTICVALFVMDRCWYRARVTDVLQIDKIEVMYIDYGNTSEVGLSDLRRISPEMAEVPQLSTQCSLFGVEPPTSLSSAANPTKWPLPAIKWFDAYVFGNQFIATFLPNKSKPCKYIVHLFSASGNADKTGFLWSVADRMVCVGFASASVTTTSEAPEVAPCNSKFKADAEIVNDFKEQQKCNQKVKSLNSNSSIMTAIPAGMERSLSRHNSRKNLYHSQETVPVNTVQQRLTYLEAVEQESNAGCEVFEALVRSASQKNN